MTIKIYKPSKSSMQSGQANTKKWLAEYISDTEQVKQTRKTYFFLRPCSITNKFWAPIAKIKLNPVKKPSKIKLI